MSGKGDTPRNCFSEQYRDNYDAIFRRKPPMPTLTKAQLSSLAKDFQPKPFFRGQK